MDTADIPGVLYGRISFDRTGQGLGVDEQLRDGAELGERERVRVVRAFRDDDKSAYKEGRERPDYEAMLVLLDTGTIKVVICWHPDRLHRDPDECGRFIKLGRKHGIIVLTVTAGSFDLSTAYGRKALRDATSNAGYESEHRAERVTSARRRQARTGLYGGGSKRPYGFGVPTGDVQRYWDKTTQQHVMRPIIDMGRARPEEAAEIQTWARDLLSGVSVRQILASLRKRGVPTSTGGGWDAATIKRVVTNPRVSGHAIYKGAIVARDVWDCILPDDTRLALVDLFADPKRRTNPGSTPRWLGSLIYRCGICNNGETMKVRRTSQGVPVYRCTSAQQHCQRPALEVDGYVARVLVARLSREDALDLIARPEADGIDVAALREQSMALRQRKRAQIVAHARGEIDDEDLTTGSDYIKTELAKIKEQLRAAHKESPLAAVLGGSDVEAAWEACSLGQRRAILRLLADVTLLPAPIGRPPKGGRPFYGPDAVRIAWKAAS
ncbi:recombinase family protein [Streptomyces cinnamoneus]